MEKKNKLLKFFVILFIFSIIFIPGAIKYFRLWNQNRILTKEIKRLEDFNKKLTIEKTKLQNDIDYIEKVARKKMGIVKKGEVIYKIEKK